MNVLLIITTGRTDVQLVKENKRYMFSAKSCASLHQAIQERGHWTFVDDTLSKDRDDIDELPATALVFATPKLDAVLEYARNHAFSITHALILDTRREDPQFKDPFLAGRLIEQRLLEKVQCSSTFLTYLEGDEWIVDDPQRIKPSIVSKIERGIRHAFDQYKPNKTIVAATGGLPVVIDLVEEIVKLNAIRIQGNPSVNSLIILDIPDTSKSQKQPGTAIAPDIATEKNLKTNPRESFEAKRHALELLQGGHILGAWGATQHIDKSLYPWTQALEWMYLWFTSQHIPEDCTLLVLKSKFRAVRSALYVDFALKANDVPRAVHGTVEFLASALWDHLERDYITNPGDPKRQYFLRKAPDEKLIAKGQGRASPDYPFAKKDHHGHISYKISDAGEAPLKISRDYLQTPNLSKLAEAISQDIRDLRHDVAHNIPTPAVMAEARQKMLDRGLWCEGTSFLDVPLVRDVLAELGVNPSTAELLDALQREILAEEPKRTPA